jgi:hypothetical protein
MLELLLIFLRKKTLRLKNLAKNRFANLDHDSESRLLTGLAVTFYLYEMSFLSKEKFFYLNESSKLIVLVGLFLVSVSLALNFYKRICAFIIWLFFVFFFTTYPLFREIQTSYLSLILLFYFLFEENTKAAKDKRTLVFATAYLLAYGFSYSFQGYIKFLSSDWLSGENLKAFTNFGTSENMRNVLASLPIGSFKIVSWLVALVELGTLPFVLTKKYRYRYMMCLCILHILIGIFAGNLVHITTVMLVFNFHALSVFLNLDRLTEAQ